MTSGANEGSPDLPPEFLRSRRRAGTASEPGTASGEIGRGEAIPTHPRAGRDGAAIPTRRITGRLSLVAFWDALDPQPEAVGQPVD